jgi:hypothetical protein
METNMGQQKGLYSAAGWIAVCGGLLVIGGVTALKYCFGYPDIIRAEPAVIMERLHAARHIVPYLYYAGVGGAGLCLFLYSILLGEILKEAGDRVWATLGRTCGIVAGVLLYVGIIRYSILFPKLAAMKAAGVHDPDTMDLVFKAMNTYVGESVAEHAQFTFSALMFLFFGMSIFRTQVLPKWLVIFCFVTSAVIVVGNLEPFGFGFAFVFNRTAAKMLAVWLVCSGSALLWKRSAMA